METLGRTLLLIALFSALACQVVALPPTGSQLATDENTCAQCHGEQELWEADQQRFYVSLEGLVDDAHFRKGVNCHDCHGGNPASFNVAKAHQGLAPLKSMRQTCARCHQDQALGLLKGVHAKSGDKDNRGRGLPLDCGKCHGAKAHPMQPVDDDRSPVFLNHQVRTCGQCHPEDEQTYGNTVHGKGLVDSGLLATAVCADCHGAHGIYYAADRRSTLHASKVAATCTQCHKFIQQRLESSVHGRGGGLGTASEHQAPGGNGKRTPSCTDCHQGHHFHHPDLSEFRLQLANRCGNCHAEVSSHYSLSKHGKLTHQGIASAANCADCHGAHDILPVDDPNSRLAVGENRHQTCQACHLRAVIHFTDFDPHADFKDASRSPGLHVVYSGIKTFVNLGFGCFLLHAFLWFVRALIHRLRHGGHVTLVESEQYALPRFGLIHRALYVALVVAFLGLTVTGLTLKTSNQNWGEWLARGLGGSRAVSVWHHFFAVMAIVACVIHLARAIAKIVRLRRKRSWNAIVTGPDSPVLGGRDLRDFWGMVRWFLGLRQKPTFERWTYWEKLDYWAFFLATALIGISGLMLWYPNLFCLVLSGRVLNGAQLIHSEFAIYVASFLFLIHFFHAHFRPEKFPMDLSVLTGLVSLEHLRKHRPEYISRLESEGKLDRLQVAATSNGRLWLHVFWGLLIYSLGLSLLAVTLLASLGE